MSRQLELTPDEHPQRDGTRESIETSGGSGSNDAKIPVQRYAPANIPIEPKASSLR